jgi:hypothetical protein
VPEFLRRFRAAAEASAELVEDFTLNYGLVEYVPERTYVGEMGPTKKFDRFVHQSEFRFFIDPGLGKPLTLTLGPLTDIAELGVFAGASTDG